MAYLELNNVTFAHGSGAAHHVVLEDASLAVEQNELVAVIGFSGSGKSTLMALLAGLLMPHRGEVLIGGARVTGPGPDKGIVFQNYSLLPWLTVVGNIDLAVRQVFPELSAAERRDHCQRYIDVVNLTGSEAKRPGELSGGMRQRLSLARTLSMRPEVLLLDEPLSALDALTRAQLQDEILRILEEDQRTVVLITNDVDEALLMADRIVPLTPGPAAHFGQEFAVNLPRPRDRATLNFCPEFKRLRNSLTRYLLDMNEERRRLSVVEDRPLPMLEPMRPKLAVRVA